MIANIRIKDIEDIPKHILCCQAQTERISKVTGEKHQIDLTDFKIENYICGNCGKKQVFRSYKLIDIPNRPNARLVIEIADIDEGSIQ